MLLKHKIYTYINKKIYKNLLIVPVLYNSIAKHITKNLVNMCLIIVGPNLKTWGPLLLSYATVIYNLDANMVNQHKTTQDNPLTRKIN